MRNVIFVAAMLFLVLRGAHAAPFVFETLTVPGAAGAGARGIDDAGVVVGYSDIDGDHDTAIDAHAILWDGGVAVQLDHPGSTGDDRFFDINNAGLVVGSTHVGTPLIGYLYDRPSGLADTFLFPGGFGTTIRSVNDRGDLAGEWDDALGARAGFVCIEGGSCTSIEIPGAAQTSVRGINNAGQLVGYYFDALMVAHNCFFTAVGDDWTCASIDLSGIAEAESSVLFGLNDSGLAVGGYFRAAEGLSSAQSFIYDLPSGTLLPFAVPGATATVATGVNDRGQIVGEYIDGQGRTLGFVATPVPEPGGIWVLALAVAVIATMQARERP